MNFLYEIVAAKEKEIEIRKSTIPAEVLKQSAQFSLGTLSLTEALKNRESSGIIAEIKRKSPSKGVFNSAISISELAAGYCQAGAAALSVLTDEKFFGGNLQDLKVARQSCTVPILRKDFVLDEYQIIEARSCGADVILLIASILSAQQINDLSQFAHSLSLEVLLEVHNVDELNRSPLTHIDIIGVNNRDLSKFTVDISNSIELAKSIPDSFCKISESGINTVQDIAILTEHGFNGFLIGESFMREPDPALACQRLVSAVRSRGGQNAAA